MQQNSALKIALAALALTFGIYIYLCPPGGGGQVIPPNNDTLAVAIPLPDSSTVCVECSAETVGQPMDHFKKVLENYRKNVWDSINQSTLFNMPTKGLNYSQIGNNYARTDARCIWFSLESIKQFICTIEKNNAKIKIPAQDMGVRFYYAVYESDYSDPEKQNRHTLFMVPTYRNPAGEEVDFDPRKTVERQHDSHFQGKYDSAMVTIFDLMDETQDQNALFLAEGEPNPANKKSTNMVKRVESAVPLVKNNGSICPTHCPTSSNLLSKIDN